MWSLKRPTRTARDTFTRCIGRVRNDDLRGRLQAITETVEQASNDYDVAAQAHNLHRLTRSAMVGGVTKDEMCGVYDKRMAKLRSPGRKIYNELISTATNKCPLCGHRNVTMLDHHLPKAYYPVLAVTPTNLVPSCGDCNKTKSAAIPLTAAQVSLHPYFDHIDNRRWLKALVIEAVPTALQFVVDGPAEWDALLRQRVLNHFELLSLGPLYATEAAEELVNIRDQLRRLHAAGGVNCVRGELRSRAASALKGRRNGWRSAAYRAWAASQWFCDGGFASTG